MSSTCDGYRSVVDSLLILIHQRQLPVANSSIHSPYHHLFNIIFYFFLRYTLFFCIAVLIKVSSNRPSHMNFALILLSYTNYLLLHLSETNERYDLLGCVFVISIFGVFSSFRVIFVAL